jgi:hypothetical protein
MQQHHEKGSFYITTTNSGTSDAEMQLVSSSAMYTSNSIYRVGRPQSETSNGFTLSFQLKIDWWSEADAIFAFFGTSRVPDNEWPPYPGNSSIVIGFNIYRYGPQGIYLRRVNSTGYYSTLASYSEFYASGNWESVTITYIPSSSNSWKVCVRGIIQAFPLVHCSFK